MRSVIRVTVLAAAAFGAVYSSCTAAAQPKEIENAALWYWRAIAELDWYQAELDAHLDRWQASEGADKKSREWIAARVEELSEELDHAASIEECGFPVSWEDGFMATMPHVKGLRRIGELLRADAEAHLAEGDHNSAASRIATIIVMADHIGQDPNYLSLRIASMLISKAGTLSDEVNVSALRDEARRQVMVSLRRVSDINAQRVADAASFEGKNLRECFKRRWSGLDGKKLMREDFSMIMSVDGGNPPTPDYRQLEEQFELWEQSDARIVAAIENRRHQEFDSISSDLTNGNYGWLAPTFTGNFVLVYEEVSEVEELIADLIEQYDGES